MSSHLQGQLIYANRTRIGNGEKTVSLKMALEKLDSYMQKNQIELISHTIHKKINSKWVKDSNVRLKPIKLLEKKYRQHDFKHCFFFFF